jgi:hypothetical protein
LFCAARCEAYKLKIKVCIVNHSYNIYLQYCMQPVAAFMVIINYIKSQNTLRKDNCNSNFQWQTDIKLFTAAMDFIKKMVYVSDIRISKVYVQLTSSAHLLMFFILSCFNSWYLFPSRKFLVVTLWTGYRGYGCVLWMKTS